MCSNVPNRARESRESLRRGRRGRRWWRKPSRKYQPVRQSKRAQSTRRVGGVFVRPTLAGESSAEILGM